MPEENLGNLRWTSVKGKSSRPHNLNITLTSEQEDRICFERK